MKHGRAKRWLPWAGVAVSLLFTYVALRDVDFQLFGRVLARGDYWLLAPAKGSLGAVGKPEAA